MTPLSQRPPLAASHVVHQRPTLDLTHRPEEFHGDSPARTLMPRTVKSRIRSELRVGFVQDPYQWKRASSRGQGLTNEEPVMSSFALLCIATRR